MPTVPPEVAAAKPRLPLSIGDPTLNNSVFRPPPELASAVAAAAMSTASDAHAYPPSFGTLAARKVVAESLNEFHPVVPATPENVILTCGASQALEFALAALLDPGDTVLLPRPTFSLYQALCTADRIAAVYYPLLADREWEVDIPALEALAAATPSARAILICNPSNPCGSVWPAAHVRAVVAAARRLGLAVIADEVYTGIVFPDAPPTATAAAVGDGALVISVGAISKRFMCPGWRLGWLAIHDATGRGAAATAALRDAIVRLSTRVLGPCSLVQHALPAAFAAVPAAYHAGNNAALAERAAAFCDSLASACPPGSVQIVRPRGALYVMMRFMGTTFGDDDVALSGALLMEENVHLLPGSCFRAPSFCRAVVTLDVADLRTAAARMGDFVRRHSAPARPAE